MLDAFAKVAKEVNDDAAAKARAGEIGWKRKGALGLETETAGSVPEALARALAVAAPDDLVLVSGSLYVVGAARAALGTR